MKQNIRNEYDFSKKMLNTMRNLNNRYLASLHEDLENDDLEDTEEEPNIKSEKNDIIVINDVEVNILAKDESDLELDEQQKQIISSIIDEFKNKVSQTVEFEPGMTINDNQIRLDGSIITDNTISFVLIAGDEMGIYINAEMLKLDDEVINTLQKLTDFKNTFVDSMHKLINIRKNNLDIQNNNT